MHFSFVIQRIAKTWEACSWYIENLNCIEPNTEELDKVDRNGFGRSNDFVDKIYDHEHINAMVKMYRKLCDTGKFLSNYGPFGQYRYG